MFNCELCEFNTNYQSTYNEHLRSTTHFLKTGERLKDFRYECLPCNFKTYYKSKYDEHSDTKNHLIRIMTLKIILFVLIITVLKNSIVIYVVIGLIVGEHTIRTHLGIDRIKIIEK
jgi:hypothetical protein